jgi:competence protein ComEA
MKKLIMLSWIGSMFFALNVMAAPVSINTADAQTIADALSGIGLKKAEAIVKYRQEKGPFKTLEELGNVTGIGEKTIEKNKNDILLGNPAPAAAKPAAVGKHK